MKTPTRRAASDMPLLTLRGLLFDLDGTLTKPALDFEAIRADLGLPRDTPILEHMARLNDVERSRQLAVLERHELAAAARSEPNVGWATLAQWLGDHPAIRTAVITRNSRSCAEVTLSRLGFVPHAIVSREDAAPKPAPDSVWMALHHLRLPAVEAAMIGDFRFDIEAGKAAGVGLTVFITNRLANPVTAGADWVVADLHELTHSLAGLLDGAF